MLTDIVTKNFHNLKLQRDMNILQENYPSIDSCNEKHNEQIHNGEKANAYRYRDKMFS